MTDDPTRTASMGRLIGVYVTALLTAVVASLIAIWAIQRYLQTPLPIGMLFILLPMISAMQSGGSYFKQTGRAAGFGYSCLFGLVSTLLLLLGVIGLWQLGYLDPILSQIDPGAFQRQEIMTVLPPLLIVVGAIGIFGNVLMFWAWSRAMLKQQERKDQLAGKGR